MERKPTEKDMEYLDKWTRRSAITHGISDERLMEICEAERDGRCVVLPCKVEDDVYINIFGRTLLFSVISISQMASTPTFKAMHGATLCYIFKADDMGKTVFLTREAAEAALQRGQIDGIRKG